MPDAAPDGAVDRSRPEPLGVQLSGQVRDLVLAGTLGPGDRLPSTRALAAELGVARVGHRAGLRPAARRGLAGGETRRRHLRRLGRRPGARRAGPASTPPTPADLVWLDAGTPVDRPAAPGGLAPGLAGGLHRPAPRGYDDPRGLPELRTALADHVARTRGLAVDPDELVVTNGTTDGLRHVLSVLPPGPVALEDPGYRAAVETVRGAGRPVATCRRPRRSPTCAASSRPTSPRPTSTRSAG